MKTRASVPGFFLTMDTAANRGVNGPSVANWQATLQPACRMPMSDDSIPAHCSIPDTRAAAQQRMDRVRAFRQELATLEAEGVVVLDESARTRIDHHHAQLALGLRERFDIDIDDSQRQLSLGMRMTSLIGALALSAAVFFFFYRIWGLLHAPVQVGLLVAAPILAVLAGAYASARDSSGYFTSLAALVAVVCMVLNLSLLGQIFNLVPSRNAFLVWALFAGLLAYAWRLKLVLVAALVGLTAWLSASVGAWGGLYWLSFGERPENLLLAGLIVAAAGFFRHRVHPDFAVVYRIFGLLVALTSVLILSHWGRSSYLPGSPGLIEGGYQVAGFVGSAVLIWLGTRRDDRKLFNLGATFFLLFLYTKIFDWWWAWLPKWLFFLIVAAVAVGLLLALGRLRRRGQEART